jgi:hypothetical protein
VRPGSQNVLIFFVVVIYPTSMHTFLTHLHRLFRSGKATWATEAIHVDGLPQNTPTFSRSLGRANLNVARLARDQLASIVAYGAVLESLINR